MGEKLPCYHDTRNHHDPFVVVTCKGMTVGDTCIEGYLQYMLF